MNPLHLGKHQRRTTPRFHASRTGIVILSAVCAVAVAVPAHATPTPSPTFAPISAPTAPITTPALPLPTPLPAAGLPPQPTAAELAAAKTLIATLSGKLTAQQASIDAATKTLTQVTANAELAVEAYNRAQINVAHAKAAASSATKALTAATKATRAQQQQVDAWARSTYVSGGGFNSMLATLSATSPQDYLDKRSVVGQIAKQQNGNLTAFALTQQNQKQAEGDASVALDLVALASTSAQAASLAATTAAALQSSTVQSLNAQRKQVGENLIAALGQQGALDAAQALKVLLEQQTYDNAAQVEQLALSLPPYVGAGANASSVTTAEQGLEAVAWAKTALGMPYSWGAGNASGPTLGFAFDATITSGLTTVGYDCSGLTLFAWAHAGRTLGHYTGFQWESGMHVPVNKIRAGDLVFYASDITNADTIHHVGIYVADGIMINAPYTGAVVRYDRVFKAGLIGAVRP